MNTVAWDADDDDVTGTEAAVVVPHRSHKDTRRWCKGRPGRQHLPQIMIPHNAVVLRGPLPTCGPSPVYGSGWSCYHAEVCTACGKHLRGWGFLPAEECPDFDEAAALAAVAKRRAW